MGLEHRNGIILRFVDTCYDFGCITSALLRCTADFADNEVKLQILVKSDISEDEEDRLRLIGAYIIADSYDAMLDEDFIKLKSLSDEKSIPSLAYRLYRSGELEA